MSDDSLLPPLHGEGPRASASAGGEVSNIPTLAAATPPPSLPTSGEGEADLTHVRSWIFDLDDTLYPPETQFMGLIQQRINAYMVRTVGLPAVEAMAVQKGYLRDYGTSLAGLMAHYHIDPRDFLAEVHDVPLDLLSPDPGLRAGLERLKGPRIVFTNGATVHAHRVLGKLGIDNLFDGVFALEDADLIPKPDPRTFARMTDRFGIDPATAAFFEDTPRNLKPAKAIGMTTVLVGARAVTDDEDFIDFRAAALGPFLATAHLAETSQ